MAEGEEADVGPGACGVGDDRERSFAFRSSFFFFSVSLSAFAFLSCIDESLREYELVYEGIASPSSLRLGGEGEEGSAGSRPSDVCPPLFIASLLAQKGKEKKHKKKRKKVRKGC